MKRLMKVVENFVGIRSVWRHRNAMNFWNGATVTKIWMAFGVIWGLFGVRDCDE